MLGFGVQGLGQLSGFLTGGKREIGGMDHYSSHYDLTTLNPKP